jgi:hypothetical protein
VRIYPREHGVGLRLCTLILIAVYLMVYAALAALIVGLIVVGIARWNRRRHLAWQQAHDVPSSSEPMSPRPQEPR